MSDEGYLEMTETRFYGLPPRVQEAIRVYGREAPERGKPRRIYLSLSRLKEIEGMLAEETS